MTKHTFADNAPSLRNRARTRLLASVAALVLLGGGATVAAAATSTRSAAPKTVALQAGYQLHRFAPLPTGLSKPDDLALLGRDVFVGYQNGVGSMGEPAAGTGQTQSTIVEYGPHGRQLASWTITGKCDGLGADPATHELIATVNEDGNSSLYTIQPSSGDVDHFTYNVDPVSLGGGGTDAVSVQGGTIYVSGSNPAGASAPAVYAVSLDVGSGFATLTSTFTDDAPANGPSGPVTLALTDPDSNGFVPISVAGVGGDFVLVSQADAQLIFVKDLGSATQTLTQLPIGTNTDDITFVTSHKGSLLLTDNATGQIFAISSNHFTPGTVFVDTAGDSGVPGLVGTVNLTTGQITPIASGFTNPHGMLFVQAP